MVEVQTRVEGRRGCGYRKPGGIYLVGPPGGRPCCKLPFPLGACPCCGAGIKPARGWTWVDSDKLFFPDGFDEYRDKCEVHDWPGCPLSRPGVGSAGLIWVGEQYYKTPADFAAEANLMGVSRRISAVPKGFKLGETWVLLAHRKAIVCDEPIRDGLFVGQEGATQVKYKPAVFEMFRPTALKYVVKGGETQEELEGLVRRGLTPVAVKRPNFERRAFDV